MSLIDPVATDEVLSMIRQERARQDAKWGQQSPPLGISRTEQTAHAEARAKAMCDIRVGDGTYTWMDILEEEWAELRNAADECSAVREATQLAAVLAAMIESIERNRRIGSGEIP